MCSTIIFWVGLITLVVVGLCVVFMLGLALLAIVRENV